jgi:hypothetical protein
MADLKDLAGDASQRAALAAGTQMAKRALEDLTLTAEEKAQRDDERKKRRNQALLKYGIVGVVGIVAVFSLMSALASLWMYALGLLVVFGLGAGAYFYAKPKVLALKARAAARLAERNVAQEAADQERAARDAVTAKQQKLEDELAALKKKAR